MSSETSRLNVALDFVKREAGEAREARPREVDYFPQDRSSYAQRNEARLFALQIVRDRAYREALLKAARARTLPAAVETTLLAYAYGRPTERVELGRPGSFSELEGMSNKDLVLRARALSEAAEQLDTSEAAQLAAESSTNSAVLRSIEKPVEEEERRAERSARTAEELAEAEKTAPLPDWLKPSDDASRGGTP
jgi:hypothetical protein